MFSPVPGCAGGIGVHIGDKGVRRLSLAEKNLGIMRIPFLRLRLIAALVTDMDTEGRFYSNRTVVSASMRRP